MDWREGYPTEEYIFGYFTELAPGILRLACLSEGLGPPASKPLRYLELGFGQGVTINIHAAAVPGEFWGTDFNPTYAAFARTLADASGSGAVLLNDLFAELAERSDLPEFDIIALHGIWSWVSDENRRIIVDIIRRKLRVGGLVYISYNCFPGWGPTAPLRHLIKLYGDLASSDVANMVDRLDAGMKFAQQVVDAGARYFRDTPLAIGTLKAMNEKDKRYLSHEYLTHDWRLMAFSDVARMLLEAKLAFAASATLLDHIDAVNLRIEGQKLLAEIKHPILRQSVRDYMINRNFRRDIFVKGLRQLSRLNHMEALESQAFILTMHPDDIPMKVTGALGDVTLQETIYRPLIEVLADENYAPKSIGQLNGHAKLQYMSFQQLRLALLMLSGTNRVHPAQEVSIKSHRRCTELNRYICEQARDNGSIACLASPVTGSGIPLGRPQQLFLLAIHLGKKTVAEQVAFAWESISSQGNFFGKDGKRLESADESVAELTQLAGAFNEKRLPILKALGIA